DPVEALAELRSRLPVAFLPLALPHRPFVPFEPEPLEVVDDLRLPAGNVARGVRVVDPEQHPVAEAPVGDGAESVPDVQGTGRAGCETDSGHLRPSLESGPVEAALLVW